MAESGDEITFRLRIQRDPARRKWWLVAVLQVGEAGRLAMVLNPIATRSVITPPAYRRLREAGLIGADIFDFRTGRVSCILQSLRISGQVLPDVEVRIRDVEELLVDTDRYVVDGYLGLDYLFGAFSSVSVDTTTLWVTLRLRP